MKIFFINDSSDEFVLHYPGIRTKFTLIIIMHVRFPTITMHHGFTTLSHHQFTAKPHLCGLSIEGPN